MTHGNGLKLQERLDLTTSITEEFKVTVMGDRLRLMQIRQILLDQLGGVSDRVLDELMALILAARLHQGKLLRQQQEAADNIELILTAEHLPSPGHRTAHDEAARLVESAVYYI